MPPTSNPRRATRQFREKRLLLVVSVIAGMCVLAYAGHRVQVNRQAPTLLERGLAAIEEKNWKGAIETLTQYLRLRPRDAEAYVRRADAYAGLGRYKDAVDGYAEGLSHNPDQPQARLKLAKLYVAGKRWSTAREQLRKLTGEKETTGDAETYLMLADCDLNENKFADERRHLELALAKPGAPPIAHYRLADRIRSLDRSPQAIANADAILNQLVEARPGEWEPLRLRAAYRRKYNDRAGAKADLELAYRTIPSVAADLGFVEDYVGVLRAENDTATAEQVLRASLTRDPKNRSLSLMLVNLLFELKTPAKTKEAQEIVRVVSAELPEGDRLLLFLGDVLLDANDQPAAQAAAERLSKAQPALAKYIRGRLALLNGDWSNARGQLLEAIPAISVQPPERAIAARAHLALASIAASALDTAAQLESAQMAENLGSGPIVMEARLLAADALVRQEKLAEAAERLRGLPTALIRLPLARLRFAEAVAQPTEISRWVAFDSAAGEPPYPDELTVLVARSRMIRNDPKALPALEDSVKKSPASLELWLGLIAILAERDIAAAKKKLDEAVAALGDRAALRRARAGLIVVEAKAIEPTTLAKLATENTTAFSPSERGQLLRTVADLLAVRGFLSEALPLVQQSLPLAPTDLTLRLQYFDLANSANDAPACDAALAEIRKLDTDTGAAAVVATITRELRLNPKPTPEQFAKWREQATAAATARRAWPHPHSLLGDLAKLEGKAEEAIKHYKDALARGGAGNRVGQATLELLLARQNFEEATRLMAQLEKSGGLSPSLRNQMQLLRAASGEEAEKALKWVASKEMAESDSYRDHLLRSFVFKLHGRTEEAKAALDKALARNNTAPEVWEARVRHFIGTSPKDAATEVEKATVKLLAAPDQLAARLTLGFCRELVGQAEKAEAEYREAVKLDEADRRPLERLFDLYRRTSRSKDADALLEGTIGKGGANAKWARRQLAFAMLDKPDGFARINEAVALIDKNAQDGGEAVDDIRAKAVVEGFDPLRRKEALATPAGTLTTAPLSTAETLLYARLFLQAGQTEEAERLLLASTASGPRAAPSQLAMLASVQTSRGNLEAARRTVNRLKLIDPFGWNTAVEEARILAKTDTAVAAKVLLAHKAGTSPELRTYLIAPTLGQIGCTAEAKKLLEDWLATNTSKGRHILLAEFLIRQKQPEEAITLAFKFQNDVPPGLTARLLSGAVQSRHPESTAPAQRDAWRKQIEEVGKWVNEKAKTAPNDGNLLFSRAELATARGAYDEAIELFGKAAEATADRQLRAALRANRAWLLAVFLKDGGEETRRMIDEAIVIRGPSPALLDTRAAVKIAGKQFDEALADLDAAIAADPKPAYHFRRAVLFDKWKRPEARDRALADANQRGLTRDLLHPLDWPDYDRLVAK